MEVVLAGADADLVFRPVKASRRWPEAKEAQRIDSGGLSNGVILAPGNCWSSSVGGAELP